MRRYIRQGEIECEIEAYYGRGRPSVSDVQGSSSTGGVIGSVSNSYKPIVAGSHNYPDLLVLNS